MSELLPTVQARDVQRGLLDYLTTTFALADPDAQRALAEFLQDGSDGIFKGPYLRLRLPFRPAEEGWQASLAWRPPFTPYGHQAAAFARLTTADRGQDKPRPLPTLVTTGTGSGKTEAFLYPILDHVLRARRAGLGGLKALILYPMNALANDQAGRLAALLTSREDLAGVTAALYTGQAGPTRTSVTSEGLITDRGIIRDSAPDILLTNYKMLDQLLLRHEDQRLWEQSATSLQYLVLDEFHTYDGAQGTDVAMLLRRLGIALKSHWPAGDPGLTDEDWARPLGRITPVATSATLGDGGDPAEMVSFAQTVFGEGFDDSSVVTEARLDLPAWTRGAAEAVAGWGLAPARLARAELPEVNASVAGLGTSAEARDIAVTVLAALYGSDDRTLSGLLGDDPERLLALVKAHPLIQQLIAATVDAVSLADLAEYLFPEPAAAQAGASGGEDERVTILVHLAAALSHVRATVGLAAATVDLHLWVRELSRIDRVAAASPTFLWSDDGALIQADSHDPFGSEGRPAFPAIYCRHCGRSGWGVGLGPVGQDLDSDDTAIRRNHAIHEGRFRALIYAPLEAEHAWTAANGDGSGKALEVEGLRWLAVQQRAIWPAPPPDEDEDFRDGWVLPVLELAGPDADEESRDDTCPSCQQRDGIRFLGSAIATLLSVTLSTLFGAEGLDPAEKKALVFTDSVQDAAHRAGFVESRSHVLTLRSLLRDAVGESPIALDALAEEAMRLAGDDVFLRYRLLPPDLAEREAFAPFWEHRTARSVPAAVRRRVQRRLLFDAVLEFGLSSRIGRTLEATGAVAAEVEAGQPAKLAAIARAVLTSTDVQDTLEESLTGLSDARLVAWVRGVLEHMREKGAIEHEWFRTYLQEDGNRYRIWGGRPRGQGMPAFPKGRAAPAFPRVGPQVKAVKDPLLDPVTSPQAWYARWAARTLVVPPGYGAKLARLLLERLVKDGVLASVPTNAGGTVFSIPASAVVVSPTATDDLAASAHLLVCSVCKTQTPGTAAVVDQLDGAPCLLVRCPGRLVRSSRPDNYYRALYGSADMRRIVSREHSSVLDDETRLAYETGFKAGGGNPSAPNVLVATPTLEMGIDIGDLSTVLLASLPRSVASYLQRVGRAGRLTGNALDLAFVTGRGEHLPRLGDPLSVINGLVRPPATYLSAEEILQRQYVAHLVDHFARDADRRHPRKARGAIGSTEAGTFLGDLIAFAEAEHVAHLDRFLGTFADLSPAAVEAVRAWASPADGPGSSGLAAHLYAASLRWVHTVEELSHRQTAIEKALPDLEHRAGLPAANDDDTRAVRSARAALKLTRAQLKRLRGKYWIQVLEEFGILPNYTLLDDAVTLDVALTWIDPDTQEYRSEPTSIQRSASNALREFAPGSTFYARGLEIEIDSVELGSETDAIGTLAFCPDCGYAVDAAPGGVAVQVALCPRCGGAGIADAKQRLDVVELTRVSAEMRRDEASISDRRDERKKESFVVFTAADIDPAGMARRWFIQGYDFGVTYLRRLDIRWVNAGRRAGHGPSRAIGGEERPAPLFRVCQGCGNLDRSTGRNAPEEHRAWCRYRRAQDEHTRSIALTRTLKTQGVVIRLPHSVTLGDSFAVPSLSAALLLGLRELMGGSPDHIEAAAISDPTFVPGGGVTADALLLHDKVPGGTGYLAELADPERVWGLLRRAWDVVRSCACADEPRQACHRCLLPFAPSWLVDHVSRAAAERHLRAILTSGASTGEADPPGTACTWTLTEQQPGRPDIESFLEEHFRKVFTDRVVALGATAKEIPGPNGNRVLITFPGATRRWTLDPQVPVGGCRPDFVLRSDDTGVPPVAIFTDGWKYHASHAHNRIADDAAKRADLRLDGYVVLGVTAADVEAAESGKIPAPAWLNLDVLATLLESSHFAFSAQTVDALRGGPVEFLMSWLQKPEVAETRALAGALPFLFAAPPGEQLTLAADADLSREALVRLTGDGGGVVGDGPTEVPAQGWWWREGDLGLLARSAPSTGVPAIEVAVVLDDRAAALDHPSHRASWAQWLRISNALSLREQPTVIASVSQVLGGQVTSAPAAPAAAGFDLSYAWEVVVEVAMDGPEKDLVLELAQAGTIPTPEMGFEVDGGFPIDIAWPDRHVAVCFELGDDDRAALVAAGWTCAEPTVDAVAAALAATEEGGA